ATPGRGAGIDTVNRNVDATAVGLLLEIGLQQAQTEITQTETGVLDYLRIVFDLWLRAPRLRQRQLARAFGGLLALARQFLLPLLLFQPGCCPALGLVPIIQLSARPV